MAIRYTHTISSRTAGRRVQPRHARVVLLFFQRLHEHQRFFFPFSWLRPSRAYMCAFPFLAARPWRRHVSYYRVSSLRPIDIPQLPYVQHGKSPVRPVKIPWSSSSSSSTDRGRFRREELGETNRHGVPLDRQHGCTPTCYGSRLLPFNGPRDRVVCRDGFIRFSSVFSTMVKPSADRLLPARGLYHADVDAEITRPRQALVYIPCSHQNWKRRKKWWKKKLIYDEIRFGELIKRKWWVHRIRN